MNRSVLIITAKPAFYEWLSEVCVSLSPFARPEILYPPGEESVWSIPSIGTFADSRAAEAYILELKPLLLANEIQRVLSDVASFEGNLDATQFDAFFTLELRADVSEIEVLDAWREWFRATLQNGYGKS